MATDDERVVSAERRDIYRGRIGRQTTTNTVKMKAELGAGHAKLANHSLHHIPAIGKTTLLMIS